MPPGLFMLVKLQTRAALRQLLWGIRTPKGALLVGLGFVAFTLWLMFLLIPSFALERTSPELVRLVAPMALFGVCVMSTVAAAVGQTTLFSPSEIDFLFTAPFSRRELIAYKIFKGILTAMPVAVLCTLLSHRHVGSWLAGLVGFVLGLVFVQLLSMSLLLIGSIIIRRAHAETRRLALLVLLVLLTWGFATIMLGDKQADPLELARRIQQSWGGHLLLSVFYTFGRVVSAQTVYPELLAWALLALVIDVSLVLLIMRLDASYAELAWQSDLKLKPAGRATGGDRADNSNRTGHIRWSLPAFPRLYGAGPIAWRQMTSAMRAARNLIWLLLIMSATAGPVLLVAAIQGRRFGSFMASIIWLVVFVPVLFRFDFRNDLKYMHWLKTLPVRPSIVALGEIISPALLTTIVQIGLLSTLSLFSRSSKTPLTLAAIFALPFNGVTFCIENLLFLLFPEPLGIVTPGSIEFLGRQLALFLAKAILVVPCGVLALLAAGLASSVAGESWPAFYIAGWCTLAFEVMVLLRCVGWAFRRFDVTADLGPFPS